jgi:lipopolysaccharide transport system ATP-binding protein
MSVAIKIENLSKQYRLGLVSTRTLSHDLNRWWQTSILGRDDPYLKIGETNIRETKGESEYVWALKDINLEVEEGEVLGIIGKNGAGKSTLLKILSKVTAPTTGVVKARGRLASLLEVGTGFHPEMTGRENIFMNGSIMGMTKAEIRKKFDEIVDFAGVERYVDTPVKRYSSGMTVRLGFAIAAHLEPEILVVDEVLAVGDAEFQKKAIGKMQDVSRGEGRTILFVSHNMQAISVLCKNTLTLSNGQLSDYGPANKVIDRYLISEEPKSAEVFWKFENAPSGNNLKLHSVKVCKQTGEVSYDHKIGAPVTLMLEFWCLKEMKLLPSFHLYTKNGIMVFPSAPLHIKEIAEKKYQRGLHRCSCEIPASLLNSGEYSVHAFLSRETDGLAYIYITDVVSFNMINDGTGLGNTFTGSTDFPGVIRPILKWRREKLNISNDIERDL